MWQGLRLKSDAPNQFLGDMFELFLDDGIKQSEGQFFTPLPICKFIVASLPLAQKIKSNAEPIKAIDYACGSGHFLNEYAYQIKPLVETHYRDISDYYSQITGIEKEDRLAKVAKVAAYMHGQEQIKILDADALAAHPEIQQENFDVLIANPPFAVEGFLQTLNEEDKRAYQLVKATGENSNTGAIQCFFLERIHHLMAPDGLVGVIVPDSILSNPDAVHIRTRELLLQFFDLVSITELGKETFSETKNPTVVLFLRRKAQKPEVSEHYRNRVEDFFQGDDEGEEYCDHHLIKSYCEHIQVPYEEYTKLFAPTDLEQLGELLQYDIFQNYKQVFSQSTEMKNLKKSNVFKKKTPTEQSTELEHRFIAYLHNIEKDKLLYFILAHVQENKVLIVNVPNRRKEQKRFLGYEWSKRKGSEGIQYNGGDTVNDIITPLFDPKGLDNDKKINTAIKRNFNGEITDPLPGRCQYAELTDMLNFSRVDFDKTISLNPQQSTDIETKWERKTLHNLLKKIDGSTTKIQKSEILEEGETAVVTQEQDLLISGYTDKKEVITDLPLIVFGDHSCTFKYIDFPFVRGADGTQLLKVDENELIPKCFYYLVQFIEIQNRDTYERHFKYLKNLEIPLPPLEIQQHIIEECEVIDQKTDQTRQAIVAAKQQIEEKVQVVINARHEMKKIDRVLTLEYGISLPEKKRVNGNFPVYGSNGVVGSHNEFLVKAPCIIIGRKGSAGEVNWSDKNCTPIDTAFYVKLLDEKATDFKFIYHMLKSLNLPSLKGGSGPEGINRNSVYGLQIPMPPLNIQQQLVAEVRQLEAEITEAQVAIDNATERKNAILTKYL